MIKTLGLLFFLLAFLSCSDNTKEQLNHVNSLVEKIEETENDQDMPVIPSPKGNYIKYGFSFGECSGYCHTEKTIEESKITTISKTWHDTINQPKKINVVNIGQDEWENYMTSINFAVFQKMPEVIGCPDCRDGGACWVEISKSNVVHKVTFEYQNPPKELRGLISEINE